MQKALYRKLLLCMERFCIRRSPESAAGKGRWFEKILPVYNDLAFGYLAS